MKRGEETEGNRVGHIRAIDRSNERTTTGYGLRGSSGYRLVSLGDATFFTFTGAAESHYYGCVPYRKLSFIVTRIKAYTRDWSIQNVIKSCIHTSWLFPRGEPFLCDRLLEVNHDNASLRGLLFLLVTSLPFLLPLESASAFIA